MSSAERTGSNVITRLVERLSKLRVGRVSDPDSEHIAGTIGVIHERVAAWQTVHGRDFALEKWENPARAARYLETGICRAHDPPQQH